MFIRSWEKADPTSGLWDAWSGRTLGFCAQHGTGRPLYSELGHLRLLHNATHWAWQLPPVPLHTAVSTSAPAPCLVLLSEEGKRIKKLCTYLWALKWVTEASVCVLSMLSLSLALSVSALTCAQETLALLLACGMQQEGLLEEISETFWSKSHAREVSDVRQWWLWNLFLWAAQKGAGEKMRPRYCISSFRKTSLQSKHDLRQDKELNPSCSL